MTVRLVAIFCLSAWFLSGALSARNGVNPYGCQVWSPTEVKCAHTIFLKDVPQDLPSSILRLDLQGNEITQLHRQPLNALKHLLYLDLSWNRLEYAENGTFDSMTNLRILNLSRNGLGDSQWSNISSSLPGSLQTLILSGNRLQDLNGLYFMGLHKLTVLDLRSNAIIVGECAFCGQQRLQRLDMTGNEISTLPNRLFHPQSEIEILDLSNNRLSDDVLEKEDLWSGLGKLRTLNLRQNYFSIPKFAQSFRHMTSLHNIYMYINKIRQFLFQNLAPLLNAPIHEFALGYNPISIFDEGILLRLRHLKTLDLRQTSIPSSELQKILPELQNTKIRKLELGTAPGNFAIDNTTFGQLPGLEELGIYGSDLTVLKAEVLRHSKNLTDLDFNGNNVTIIDENAFTGLESLEKLQLQRNSIQTLPNKVFDPLFALTYLDLSSNSLNTISPALFKGLLNLQWLDLSSNGITKIDNTSFIGLSSLTHLDLSYNRLTTAGLPVVGPSVKSIDLKANQIEILKANEFLGFENLGSLCLESNNIRTIEPHAFQGLGKLEKLDLGGNKLRTVTGRMFEGLENVTELHFDSNTLLEIEIEPYGFYGLRRLKRLEIGFTLRAIPSYAFVGLDSLTFLDLSHNQIAKVGRHAFDGLPNMKIFLFVKNKITVFEEETFGRVVRQASRIQFEQNPFYCDCRLLWFVEWARKNPDKLHFFTFGWYKCAGPPEYADTRLVNFYINCTSPEDNVFQPNRPLACALSSSAILFYMFAVFLVSYHHWKVKYLMFLLRRRNEDDEPMRGRRFVYDAFVAHNSEDIRWVVHELCHNLENVQDQPRYKLCIHQRNFLPGAPIVNNIVKAIETSRKTICVLTRSFLRSGWCEFELQLAQTPDNLFGKGGSCRLILVFLERIPRPLLKKYKHLEAVMDRDTYLEWPGEARGRPLFWRRLRAALGKPVTVEQGGDRGLRDDENHELVPLLRV
ncbi:toll-like receptor 13 [Branchiostoma lanceolatum]|uniref:toll-like receptor 13 n=1 Tax=Branchiostoma lanceolatum TaxID=7740 RepID=UPI003455B4D4